MKPNIAIGELVAIWRYPVKSMGAEPLGEGHVSWHGLDGDRRWAFVRGGVERSGFPWLTIRERHDMGHFIPRFTDPDKPNTSVTRVRTPTGQDFDVTDPSLAAELGHESRVIKREQGLFDTFPLSLITIQTVAELGVNDSTDLDVLRFRPNLLIDAAGTVPFPEDEWVGRVLRIGNSKMRVDKRDTRCAVVNVDPTTAQSDPSVLRSITRLRDGCLGVYGSTVQPGLICVGDRVYLD